MEVIQLTQKDKLKEIIKVLNEKGVQEINAPTAIKLFCEFYGVKPVTAQDYLREMVLFGFLERPIEGAFFKIKKVD
uniref:Uncharacterized protein n=1 Tax=viral metagenome TaxID=1070528 RepID=A0A6H1ZYG4_9ZZZZ